MPPWPQACPSAPAFATCSGELARYVITPPAAGSAPSRTRGNREGARLGPRHQTSALRRDGGLGGNGAAALASGFDEAVGDDLLGLVDTVGSGRGRDGRSNAVAAPNIATDGGRRTAEEEGEGEDVGPAERGRSLRRRQHRCVRG